VPLNEPVQVVIQGGDSEPSPPLLVVNINNYFDGDRTETLNLQATQSSPTFYIPKSQQAPVRVGPAVRINSWIRMIDEKLDEYIEWPKSRLGARSSRISSIRPMQCARSPS
jgi:hypothetical protein